MKKKIITYIYILVLFTCLYSVWRIIFSFSNKEMQFKKEVFLLEEKNSDIFFRIEVNYPQLVKSLLDVSKDINIVIQDTAFSIFDAMNHKDAIASLSVEKESMKSGTRGVYVNYDILYLTDRIISLKFKAEAFYGSGSAYTTEYLTTIDLKNSRYITFKDLQNKEQIYKALREGEFIVYEGSYNEFGDSHSKKRVNGFINSLKNIDSSYEHYDRNSSQNIGLDKNHLYIYLTSPDSLNGYLILKLPLEQIEKQ